MGALKRGRGQCELKSLTAQTVYLTVSTCVQRERRETLCKGIISAFEQAERASVLQPSCESAKQRGANVHMSSEG